MEKCTIIKCFIFIFLKVDDILGNAGTTSHPLVEQKKTARKATTPKHSTTKPPRQSLPRTKQKRKLDESLASESLPLANS